MQHPKEKYIIYIPILLLLAFLVFPLLDQRENKKPVATKSPEKSAQTGFLDYDLLPEALKKEMHALQQKNTSHWYYFTYYFDNDDVNHRYYVTDARHKIIKQMSVTSNEAMDLVEQYMLEDQGGGQHTARDQRLFSQEAKKQPPWYIGHVGYVLPQDKENADFSKLKVAILEMNFPEWVTSQEEESNGSSETRTYRLSEVDETPKPIRGIEYFKEVVADEIKRKASFLYDQLQGDVLVSFTIGSNAKSPQVVKGFSTVSNTHEAYRMDGIIIKAINNSKVHWKLAKKDGKYVSIRIAMTLSFNKENQDVLLSMSQLQETSKTW